MHTYLSDFRLWLSQTGNEQARLSVRHCSATTHFPHKMATATTVDWTTSLSPHVKNNRLCAVDRICPQAQPAEAATAHARAPTSRDVQSTTWHRREHSRVVDQLYTNWISRRDHTARTARQVVLFVVFFFYRRSQTGCKGPSLKTSREIFNSFIYLSLSIFVCPASTKTQNGNRIQRAGQWHHNGTENRH